MGSVTIARNVGSGLIAQVVTAALGVAVLPIFTRGLGAAGYGVLGVCAVITGVGSIFDLGVGRALAKFVAEEHGRQGRGVQSYLGVGVTLAIVMGTASALVLALATPFLVNHFFHVPRSLVLPARIGIWLTAAALPGVLFRMVIEGLLVGYQRIAFVNVVNVTGNMLKASLGITAVLAGYSVAVVVAVNVLTSYAQILGLMYYSQTHLPERPSMRIMWSPPTAQKLLRFGIASTVCVLMGYILLYLDRFVIGAFLPFVWVGYYTGAFDITSKQWNVSNSIAHAFFPVFSASSATDKSSMTKAYINSSRAVVTATTGLAILLMIFAHEILGYWTTSEFALHASDVMIILTVGILAICYLSVPYTMIFASAERPEIYLIIYGLGAVLHVIASLLLVQRMGIEGVALAFSGAHVIVLMVSLRWIQRNLVPVPLSSLLRSCVLPSWYVAAGVGFFWWSFVKPRVDNVWHLVMAFGSGYFVYLVGCGFVAYTREERVRAWQIGRDVLELGVK